MQRVQQFTRAAGLAAAFMVGSAGLHAQTQPQTSGAAKPATGQQPSSTAQAGQQPSADDMSFAQRAAESGMMEVEHGRMAASKATNAQVKAFGNKLVKDHTAANNQLMAIAKRKNITLPAGMMKPGDRGSVGSKDDARSDTKTGKPTSGNPNTTGGTNPTGTTGASGTVATTGEARTQTGQDQPWMSQTGGGFDKGFIDAQVKMHEEAVALFEKQSTGGTDKDLKAFAAKQLPALRGHLKQAQDLQKKLGSSTN